MAIVNKEPYTTPEMIAAWNNAGRSDTGALTQEAGTTEYTILPEVTFRKSRWVRRGNAIHLSCYFTCNTSATAWKPIAKNVPLSTAILDYNVHGVVYEFATGKVATNAGMLLQSGTLYLMGGIPNTDYLLDFVYLTD